VRKCSYHGKLSKRQAKARQTKRRVVFISCTHADCNNKTT